MQLGVVVCYAAAQVVALGLQGRNIGRSQHQLRADQAFMLLPNYISNTLLDKVAVSARVASCKLQKVQAHEQHKSREATHQYFMASEKDLFTERQQLELVAGGLRHQGQENFDSFRRASKHQRKHAQQRLAQLHGQVKQTKCAPNRALGE